MTTKNDDDKQIKGEFAKLQGRQIVAVAIALFMVILMAVVYKRNDLFGEFSSNSLFAAQLIVISSFIGFTATNWRCPACKKYLGRDIHKRVCKHCRTQLR